MDPTVTTSSGQPIIMDPLVIVPPGQPVTIDRDHPEQNRVVDYSPQLMTEATGLAILAQLHILQEQQADLATAVHLLVESGKRNGLVMTQGHYGGR
jgi:hypothetical protein